MGELIDKTKGKLKKVVGIATANGTLAVSGVLDETKGKAKGKFEDAKQAVKKARRSKESPRTRKK